MRFRTPRDRPHEDRPLPPSGARHGSLLIAMTSRPGVDLPEVMAEVESIVVQQLTDWYWARGHTLLERVPDVA